MPSGSHTLKHLDWEAGGPSLFMHHICHMLLTGLRLEALWGAIQTLFLPSAQEEEE